MKVYALFEVLTLFWAEIRSFWLQQSSETYCLKAIVILSLATNHCSDVLSLKKGNI